MTNEKQDEKLIIFNTPNNVNIEELFSDYSKNDLPKIKYLIHQINYYHNTGGYQVHVKNHAWTMCVKDGVVTSILKRLVDNNIIEITSLSNKGFKSTTYSMVQPYTISNSQVSRYPSEKHLFLQKLLADSFIAKGKDHSAFKKSKLELSMDNDRSEVEVLKATIKAQEARIAELESLLSLSTSPEPVAVKTPVQPEIIYPKMEIVQDAPKYIELPIYKRLIKINGYPALKRATEGYGNLMLSELYKSIKNNNSRNYPADKILIRINNIDLEFERLLPTNYCFKGILQVA